MNKIKSMIIKFKLKRQFRRGIKIGGPIMGAMFSCLEALKIGIVIAENKNI